MSLVKNPLVPTSQFASKPRSPFLKLNFRNDSKRRGLRLTGALGTPAV